jgi:hypothetical protein
MHHYGDNFLPVVPDVQLLHTKEHPFCGDPTCICYEDPENREQLAQAITDGLLTADDATQIIRGKTL